MQKQVLIKKMNLEGDILTIKEFGPSASRKTIIIATTGGNVCPIPGSEVKKIGLNLYMKKCLPE
jgi:hypothetical protein